MALGIRTVYQELSLLPHLSVAENMLLGRMPTRGLAFVIDWPRGEPHRRRGCSPISAFPSIDPTAPVGSLSVARQQIVEIAKALVSEPRILILDEPTAVLSAARDRAALRQGPEPRRRRHDGPLHLAPARGDLRDRRRDRRAEGRRAACSPAPVAELDQRPAHPRHGRPAAVGDLPGAQRPAPAEPVLEVERLGQRGASSRT